MRIQQMIGRLALVSLMLISAGCDSSNNEDRAVGTPPKPAAANLDVARVAGKEKERFNLKPIIERQRERLRNAPDRTGLLAETPKYSLFDEELIIRDFFQDRREGFFVDVGCAWPRMANNTYYLEKHLDWKGIGIDALEEYAAAWKRERPASSFFSYLVTDHSSAEEVFYKSENVGLSSGVRRRADGRAFGGTLEVEEITIPSTTLDDLLDREGVKKVDLLAMDIEGFELAALHGFDIDRFRPDLVITEGKSPKVKAFFNEHGYELIERYKPFDLVNEYYRPREGAPASH